MLDVGFGPIWACVRLGRAVQGPKSCILNSNCVCPEKVEKTIAIVLNNKSEKLTTPHRAVPTKEPFGRPMMGLHKFVRLVFFTELGMGAAQYHLPSGVAVLAAVAHAY